MSTSSVSPIFTGVSTYASDLQSVVARAVGIASLPLHQLQNQLQDMNDAASALDSLDAKFSSLQTAIRNIDSALGPGSYAAASSDSSLVSASVGSGALDATYTMDVSSIGSYSSAVSSASLPAVADPYSASISASSAFTLTVNGKTFDIEPAGVSLMTLAQAINNASAGVQASIVNTGSSSSPAYRLILRSSNLGPDSIQLNDGSQDLLDSMGTGELASYRVNGLAEAIQSTSRTVTLAPGVTANLLGPTASGRPVTLTVSRDAAPLSSAISAFVTAYNATIDALGQQFGPNAGALSGHSIVRDLSQSLRKVTQFTGMSGGVGSLAQMGLKLDNLGRLSFDSSQVGSGSMGTLQAFLGSAATGGFLKSAADALNAIEDSTSGSLKAAIAQTAAETQRQNNLIDREQQRIGDLQAVLQEQMAAADALIASLESQKNFMNNLFTAMMNANQVGVKNE